MNIVEQLRTDRKSPNVLRLKILKIRGEHPDVFIFVHEGPDDIPVYEAWLSRINLPIKYEPIPGSGKEQVLALYNSIINTKSFQNIAFFIDRDFDKSIEDGHKGIYELPHYSIENCLCTKDVLESILKDEFQCAGSIKEREAITQTFEKVLSEFRAASDSVNFLLFAARRENIDVSTRPGTSDEIAIIELESATIAFGNLSEVCTLSANLEKEKIENLRKEFDLLPTELRNKGKYELDFFRRWLRKLEADKRSETPRLFSKSGKPKGDPAGLPLRRFAIASPLPHRLTEFIQEWATIGRPHAL